MLPLTLLAASLEFLARPSFLSQLSGESPLLAQEKESEASRMIGDDEHSARGTQGPDTTAHARRKVCETGAQNGRKHDDDGEVQAIREIKRAARCDDCIISDIGSVWAAVVNPQLAFVCFPTPCGRAGCAGTPLPLAGGAYLRGSCAQIASITCGGWYLRRRVHIIPALREALEAQPTGPSAYSSHPSRATHSLMQHHTQTRDATAEHGRRQWLLVPKVMPEFNPLFTNVPALVKSSRWAVAVNVIRGGKQLK
ncbi:hypothetical protein B0H17DRAFT_1145409 [Mycena rosella]|uniref:Uncharacterized protein n=1 Tax=Mycena rosella TaxID=1033263 RepID=A0AAD7CRU6_MYCRO|nr:hypothetical protein B0H17DRAFT_1145409 [Mycena rosella]